jgi:hypothetical protein
MNGHLDKGIPMKKIFFTLLAVAAAPVFAQGLPPMQPTQTNSPNTLPPGLYVQVIDGLISVSNKGGAQSFAPGQFGFTPSPTQPPVVVPKNPAIAVHAAAVFRLAGHQLGERRAVQVGRRRLRSSLGR